MQEYTPTLSPVRLRDTLEETTCIHGRSAQRYTQGTGKHTPNGHVELARLVVRLRDAICNPEREPTWTLGVLWAPFLEELIGAGV